MTKELSINKLDDTGCMNSEIIAEYNYSALKNRFERLLGVIEIIKYSHMDVGDDLRLDIDNKFFLTSKSKYLEEIKNTQVLTLNHKYYKQNIDLTYDLISKLVTSWNRLNEVERYILFNFYFQDSSNKLIDEEMIEKLHTYKNKYFLYKKSAYIKISIMLGLDDRLMDLDGIFPEWE